MKCKFEHDEDCCNCGSPQYMAKCRPFLCGCAVPITKAKELAMIAEWGRKELAKAIRGPGLVKFMEDWLQSPAVGDTCHA